jgi:molybdopterin-guanine dinucleotide biosynthesis protein A
LSDRGPIGIVLAGGAGARLGAGRPKALVELAGATLLARAVLTLEEVCVEVVVAAPATLALPGCRAPRVDDPAGAAGPLAGIVAAVRAHPGRGAIVLGVDFPLVTPAFLRALIARRGSHHAVIPAPGGRAQPLAAVYAAAALAHLAARFETGERAVTAATAGLDAVRPDDAALAAITGGKDALLNVNTPADLAAAARALGPAFQG